MKGEISTFYDGDAELSQFNVNQILQSLICIADSVWVNADFQVSTKLPKETRKHLSELLDGLQGENRVKRWGYPFQETKGKATKIMEFERYKEMADRINESFMTDENLLPKVSLTYMPKKRTVSGVETTSKIISLRKEYWSLALADLLGADRLLIDSEYKNMWLRCLPKIEYSSIEREITRYVVADLFSVPDLTSLRTEDIIYLQKMSKPLRERLKEICLRMPIEFEHEADISKEQLTLKDEMLDFVNEKAQESTLGTTLGKDILYMVAGIIIPQVRFLPLAEKFLNWLSSRRTLGYVLFVSELRRLAKKRSAETSDRKVV